MGFGKYNTYEQRKIQRRIAYIKVEQKRLRDKWLMLDLELSVWIADLKRFNISYGNSRH